MDKDESVKVVVSNNETVIPFHTFSIDMDPVKVPTLPDLPDLPATGLPEGEHRKESKLIKIAVLSHCLIGLTNKGHVLRLYRLRNEKYMLTWHYVSESTDNLTSSQLGYTTTNVFWYRRGEGAPSLPHKQNHWWPGNTTKNGVAIKYHAYHPCKLHYPMNSRPYIWYYMMIRFLHIILSSLLIHPQQCLNLDPMIHQRHFQPSSWCLRRFSYHMLSLVVISSLIRWSLIITRSTAYFDTMTGMIGWDPCLCSFIFFHLFQSSSPPLTQSTSSNTISRPCLGWQNWAGMDSTEELVPFYLVWAAKNRAAQTN